ncbi:hypothetical protein Patl1_35261 [Pistacia atlantica]|nr:hypothetical protein Patl1_35261 [Pistacia atlantica]
MLISQDNTWYFNKDNWSQITCLSQIQATE